MYSLATDWTKLASANITTGAFAAGNVTPTATEPAASNAGGSSAVGAILNLSRAGKGKQVPSNLKVKFFGAGSDDQTFDVRIIGWSPVFDSSKNLLHWDPCVLFQGTCTLGTITGAAGLGEVATDRVVDKIVAATGFNQGATMDLISPDANTSAYLNLDIRGFAKLQFDFSMTTATNANALFAFTG